MRVIKLRNAPDYRKWTSVSRAAQA